MKHPQQSLCFLFLLCLTITTSAQEKIYIQKNCGGSILRSPKVTKLKRLTQLPTRIPMIANDVLRRSLTDFTANISFSQGEILDIESYAATDSSFQSHMEYPLPKNFLEFILSDTTIGIRSYCLQMSLDQYGHAADYFHGRRVGKVKVVLLDAVLTTYS